MATLRFSPDDSVDRFEAELDDGSEYELEFSEDGLVMLAPDEEDDPVHLVVLDDRFAPLKARCIYQLVEVGTSVEDLLPEAADAEAADDDDDEVGEQPSAEA